MVNYFTKLKGVLHYAYAIAFGFCVVFLCTCHSKENFTNNRDKTDVVLNKVAKLSDSHKTSQALLYIDSVSQEPWVNLLDISRLLGMKYLVYARTLNKPDSALLLADSMVAIAEKRLPDDCYEEKATAYFAKGDALFALQQFTNSYLYYYKGKVVGKKSYDPCLISDYDYRMGMVLYKQNRFKEASNNFKDAFDNSANCENSFINYYRRQEILNNIGLCYQNIGATDSALKFYSEAINYIKAKGNNFPGRTTHNDIAIAVISGNMATVYKTEKRYTEAIELFKQSIGINNKQFYDNDDAQSCRIKLADIYLQLNHKDSAGALLKQTDSLLHKNNYKDKVVLQEWYSLMWRLNKANNNNSVAYDYLTKYTLIKDSLQKVKARIQALDAGQQIRMFETESEIESLQRANRLKGLFITVAIVAILLASLIVFLLFNIRNRNRRHIKLLKSLNKTISVNKIELEETLVKLETESRNKSNILKILAHDLRSPIVSMAMLTDLLKANTHEPEKVEILNMMHTAGTNTLDLITEILEAANPLPVSNTLILKPVNLNDTIQQSLSLLKLKAAEKQQTLTLNLPDEILTVNATDEKLTRVLNNLVTNAIKFSNANTEIVVTLVQLNKNEAQVCIRDSGIGIPATIKDRVFDMFTDAKRYGTNGEKAYGLGLAISKQIIEGFGGKIWLKSKAGKGTTFYFTLPLIEA